MPRRQHHGDVPVTGVVQLPDGECPSGQRYGDLAGDGLARMCVPVEGSSTGVGDDAPTTLSPTTSESTSGASGADTLSTTTPITSGVDVTGEGSTTNPESTTTGGTPGTTGDGSTGGPPECATYVDDFEDGVIGGEWEVFLADLISDEGGARVFVVSTEPRDEYPTTQLAAHAALARGESARVAGDRQLHRRARPRVTPTQRRTNAEGESVGISLLGTHPAACG
jgi:hypothetical protein